MVTVMKKKKKFASSFWQHVKAMSVHFSYKQPR